MDTSVYSKETIDAKLESIHDTLHEVLDQVKRTNGRVQTLEKWRVGLTVGIGVVGALAMPNASALLKFLSSI